LHGGLHFDQVGVGGQHAGVIRDAVLARHVHDDLALDRPRKVPVVPRAGRLFILAETQDDRPLLGVDAVNAAADPDGGDQNQRTAKSPVEAANSGSPPPPRPNSADGRRCNAQHVVVVLRLLRRFTRLRSPGSFKP
jgi:hypothetical protein